MTHDLLLDEKQRLFRLEWWRFSVALLMVLTMVIDGVTVLVLHAPVLISLGVYLVFLASEATLLFWLNQKVAAQRQVYVDSLRQAYEAVSRRGR